MSDRTHARSVRKPVQGSAPAREPGEQRASQVRDDQAPDAGTQLLNASRLGHTFGAVSVTSSGPSAAVQRDVVIGGHRERWRRRQEAQAQLDEKERLMRQQRQQEMLKKSMKLLSKADKAELKKSAKQQEKEKDKD